MRIIFPSWTLLDLLVPTSKILDVIIDIKLNPIKAVGPPVVMLRLPIGMISVKNFAEKTDVVYELEEIVKDSVELVPMVTLITVKGRVHFDIFCVAIME